MPCSNPGRAHVVFDSALHTFEADHCSSESTHQHTQSLCQLQCQVVRVCARLTEALISLRQTLNPAEQFAVHLVHRSSTSVIVRSCSRRHGDSRGATFGPLYCFVGLRCLCRSCCYGTQNNDPPTVRSVRNIKIKLAKSQKAPRRLSHFDMSHQMLPRPSILPSSPIHITSVGSATNGAATSHATEVMTVRDL